MSIAGKNWGRPDDTIGVAGVINGLAPAHEAYFAAGGLGIVIGDGALTKYGPEQIVEAYYSYAISSSTKVSFDYQFINNPGYSRAVSLAILKRTTAGPGIPSRDTSLPLFRPCEPPSITFAGLEYPDLAAEIVSLLWLG